MRFNQRKDYIMRDCATAVGILILLLIIRIRHFDAVFTGQQRILFYLMTLIAVFLLIVRCWRSRLEITDEYLLFTNGSSSLRKIPFSIITGIDYISDIKIILHLTGTGRRKELTIRYTYDDFNECLDILHSKGIPVQEIR